MNEDSSNNAGTKDGQKPEYSEKKMTEEFKDGSSIDQEPKRLVRELGYINRQNLIEDQSQEIKVQSERVGGLDYYRSRQEFMVQRKKHGHLENFGSHNNYI